MRIDPEHIPQLALRRGSSIIKLEHMSTWIAVVICGIQIAAAQALALSALLPPTTPTSLNSFLKHESFGVVKLKQKNLDSGPKRLVIDVEINRVSALLEVDTGAGGTV